jgi:membrane associated rhomboid family serine protease
MLGELRDAEGVSPVDVADLEEDLRQGRISGTLLLRFGPWTGEEFKRLDHIPELRDALDSPNACFAQNLRAPGFPRASTSLSGLVFLLGVVNLWLLFRGWKINAFEAALLERYSGWLTGFEPVILDGNWWSPWSAQFVHAGPGHLLPNLAVIVYAGYRVERALGASAFLLTSSAAVAGGGLLVAVFSGLPVMGSSILGYGFLGALLTIGFRFGDTIPKRHRGFYGYGNLLLFALLFVSGLRMDQASHLGHVGGLLGGILAVVLLRPAVSLPVSNRWKQRRRNLFWAVLLGVSPLIWVPAVRLSPFLAFGATVTVDLEKAGIQFELPKHLERFTGRLRGIPAWALSASSGEAVFCGMEPIPAGEGMESDTFEAFWSQGRDLETRSPEAPASLGEGWKVNALELKDEKGQWFRIVEHNLQRGRWLVRTGYRIRSDGEAPSSVREAFFGSFLKDLVVGEPPALAKARQAWILKKDTRTSLDFADQLDRVEDWVQVEAVLKERAERDPPRTRRLRRRWNRIVRDRLALWNAHPEVAPEKGQVWLQGALAAVPRDTGVQREGILWLGSHGACEEAKMAYDAFEELRRSAALASGIAEDLGAICGGQGGPN